MYLQKRTDKSGKTYFSFSYVNEAGKRVRLKRSEHPFFSDPDEALAWAKSQEAFKASMKARVERKLAWKDKYYQYKELVKKYQAWQQKRAPNSYLMNVYYLEHFVLPFYLERKKASNVNDWHMLTQEFLDHLQDGSAQGVKKRKKPIAINTANNIIKTVNTFMDFLLAYNLVDPDSVKKVKAFPEHMTNHKDFADVISQEELIRVMSQMESILPGAAEFFYVLWNTGMRFSELFGLPINTLFKGQVKDQSMNEELTKCGVKYTGYILLESQPFYDDRRREADLSIKRKPLKGRKTISPKNSRLIPIMDNRTWNILVRRYKAQKELLAKSEYGPNQSDYVFFGELEWNKTINAVREAYNRLDGVKPKTYHCCRHSFITRLVGQTRSTFLIRMITGHKTIGAFERYLHIFEQINLNAQQATQELDFVDL